MNRQGRRNRGRIVKKDGTPVATGFDLAIGVPLLSRTHFDMEVSEWIAALKSIAAQEGYLVVAGTLFADGCDIADNRNRLVAGACQPRVNAKYLLMVDGDTTYIPADGATRLLQHMENGKQVVSAVYFGKQQPHFPIAGDIDNETNMCEAIGIFEPGKGLKKVDWAGGGFLLIDTDVFRILKDAEYEYWPGVTLPNKQFPFFHKQLHYNKRNQRYEEEGEDTTFCRKCKAAGIDIWIDTDIMLGHRMFYDVGPPDYFKYINWIKEQLAKGKKPSQLWQNRGPQA